MFRNYVISLENAFQRRAHITQEFSNKQLTFEFFDAYSPSDRMNNMASTLIPALLQNTTLSDGEKGCLLSHLVLWNRCVEENLDFITIFEDDVILSENISKYITYCYKLPSSNFILKLESFPMRARMSKICHIENRDIYALKSEYVGAAGYIISHNAAKFLISYFQGLSSTELLPIDEILFNQFIYKNVIDIYQISPALCIQDRFYHYSTTKLGSSLENERFQPQQNTSSNKKSILKRIKKQLFRMFDSRKKVSFK